MASFKKYETKKGVFWEYRIYYKDPFTQEHKEMKKRNFNTKKEAQLAAEEVERDMRDGFREENILLKDYIYYFLDSHWKSKIRESTYENKETQIKNHILPFYKNIRLQDVKPMLHQEFIDQFADKGYSRSTIANSHWFLHAVFEKAFDEGKVKRNPTKKATLKGVERDEEELEYIPSHLIDDILRAASKDNYEYYVFFKTITETGMRKGEATGLTWRDIDFEKNTININKSMDTQKGKMGKTKTYSSKRIIGVPQRVMDELRSHKKEQLKNRMSWGDEYDVDEYNLVFCRKNGQFYPKSTLFNALRRYQDETGIFAGKKEDGTPKYYSIHALRHTHAVICLESGVDMKSLQERLGHKTYEVTANTYSHVSEKMKTKSVEKYEEGTTSILKPIKIEGVFN